MTGSLKTIQIEDWPDTDRTLWENGTRPATLLDCDGPGAAWREQTKKTVAVGYGQWLSWLQSQDHLDCGIAPDQRCTRELLRAYINDLQLRCVPKTVLMRVLNLERALAVMCPDSKRDHLRAAINYLPEGHDNPDKRARLKEVAVLVELGHNLMNTARDQDDDNIRWRATRFRDGLQIALLALRPLRLKNFCGLELGRHLILNGDQWSFEIPAIEVKNNRDLAFDLPDDLRPALEEYLDYWRPLLCADKYHSQRLWITLHWTAQSASGLTGTLIRRTEEAFNRAISPQLFRDCAATSLALHDPKIVQIASAILGNSPAVCEKYYNQAQSVEASRALSDSIAALHASSS